MASQAQALLADPSVTSKNGIYEYLLGGQSATRLLNIRVFDERTKRAAYKVQTDAAKKAGESNCPLCAVSNNTKEQSKVYPMSEMEADHVSAWSKGGDSSAENCQMLCKTHNRAKGNK